MMVFSKSMGEPRSMFVYHHFWWVLPHLLWTDEELDPREASDIKHIVPKSSRQGDMTWALCVTGEPSESDYPVLLPYLTSAFSLPTSSSHSSLELYFISYSWVSSSGCPVAGSFHIHCTFWRLGLKSRGIHIYPISERSRIRAQKKGELWFCG